MTQPSQHWHLGYGRAVLCLSLALLFACDTKKAPEGQANSPLCMDAVIGLKQISIAPDGEKAYVTTGEYGRILVFSVKSNAFTSAVSIPGSISALGVTSDSSKAYVLAANKKGKLFISMIGSGTNAVSEVAQVSADPIEAAQFLPGLAQLYVVQHQPARVSIIDTATGMITGTIDLNYDPVGIYVSPDGKTVIATHTVQGESLLTIINVATKEISRIVTLGDLSTGVAVSPVGAMAAVSMLDRSGAVKLFETDKFDVIGTLPDIGEYPGELVYSPDGKRLYVASGLDKTGAISIIDLVTKSTIASFKTEPLPSSLAVAPDGTKVYFSSVENGSTYLGMISAQNNMLEKKIPIPPLNAKSTKAECSPRAQ